MIGIETLAQLPATSTGGSSPDLRFWIVMLAAMALAPFVLTMVTSFVKLVVVGSIIRSALGVNQIPPTQVITGLAMVLSVHIMFPVAKQIHDNYKALSANSPSEAGQGGWTMLRMAADAARPPLHEFLTRNSHSTNVDMFASLRDRLQASAAGAGLPPNPPPAGRESLMYDLTVLVPAFVISELTEAFQIGFLIFVPFLVIDLVVSTLLMSMGMHMLQPNTVSLPLKLLLFVLVGGWQLIIRGTVLGYA